MNARLVTALVCGVFAGACVTSCGGNRDREGLPGGLAQPPAAPAVKSEYKAVSFRFSEDRQDNAARITDEVNKLAADGWEYSGPLLSTTSTPNGVGMGTMGGYGVVLFRRPAK